MTSTIVLNIAGDILGGKWRLAIIYKLQDGPLRFSEIKEVVPGCSVKVLSTVLKEMTTNKLLIRKQYQTIPVKVTYEINPHFYILVNDINRLYKATCYYIVHNQTELSIEPEVLQAVKKEIA